MKSKKNQVYLGNDLLFEIPTITNSTGNDSSSVMSQKAVTDLLTAITEQIDSLAGISASSIVFKGNAPSPSGGKIIFPERDYSVGELYLVNVNLGTYGDSIAGYILYNSTNESLALLTLNIQNGDFIIITEIDSNNHPSKVSVLLGNIPKFKTINNTLIVGTGNITINDGKSAYQIAQDNGYTGTVLQWLTSLHGSNGTTSGNVEISNDLGDSLTKVISLKAASQAIRGPWDALIINATLGTAVNNRNNLSINGLTVGSEIFVYLEAPEESIGRFRICDNINVSTQHLIRTTDNALGEYYPNRLYKIIIDNSTFTSAQLFGIYIGAEYVYKTCQIKFYAFTASTNIQGPLTYALTNIYNQLLKLYPLHYSVTASSARYVLDVRAMGDMKVGDKLFIYMKAPKGSISSYRIANKSYKSCLTQGNEMFQINTPYVIAINNAEFILSNTYGFMVTTDNAIQSCEIELYLCKLDEYILPLVTDAILNSHLQFYPDIITGTVDKSKTFPLDLRTSYSLAGVELNDEIVFYMKDPLNCIEKYGMVAYSQHLNTQYGSEFLPNKLYKIKINNSNVLNLSSFGPLVAQNIANQNGNIEFILRKVKNDSESVLYDYIINTESKVTQSNSWLYGKTYAVLGDSLSNNGAWQNTFSELTGAQYIDGYVKGGCLNLAPDSDNGMDRARTMLQNNPDVDLIFIQNINDCNRGSAKVGSDSDTSYMCLNRIQSPTVYSTKTAALNALQTVVNGIATADRKVGTMLDMRYNKTAKKLTISGNVSTTGQISIIIGSRTYNVSVTSGMTTTNVQSKILEYDYSEMGYSDSASSTNAVLFTDTQDRGSSAPSVSVATNGTGVTISISDATSTVWESYCFTPKTTTGWTTLSNWKSVWDLSLTSIYKGLIQWLQANFKHALIMVIGLPRFFWDQTNYDKYISGEKTADDYYNGEGRQWFYTFSKHICDYCNIPYVDVLKECGMSIYNAPEYFANNNVHPKTTGNLRWAETIARLLK